MESTLTGSPARPRAATSICSRPRARGPYATLALTVVAAIMLSSGPYGAGAASSRMNVLTIAIDDLRPLFGESYGVPEVQTPNMDAAFMNGGGTAMQNSYVQVGVGVAASLASFASMFHSLRVGHDIMQNITSRGSLFHPLRRRWGTYLGCCARLDNLGNDVKYPLIRVW